MTRQEINKIKETKKYYNRWLKELNEELDKMKEENEKCVELSYKTKYSDYDIFEVEQKIKMHETELKYLDENHSEHFI